jgi:hypothetical protein
MSSFLAGRSSSYAPMNTSDDEESEVMVVDKEDPPDSGEDYLDSEEEEEEDFTEEGENTEEFQSVNPEEFKEEVDVEDQMYPERAASPNSMDPVYSESTSHPYSVAAATSTSPSYSTATARSTPRDVSFQTPEESFSQSNTPPATRNNYSTRTQPLPPATTNRSSAVKSKSKNDGEAPEDAFLSSPTALAGLGCLIGLLLSGIAVGVALGVTKPWEPSPAPRSVPSPSPTALGDTLSPTNLPTRAPIPLSLEDEELLELFASVVGDIVYAPQTPHYEAGQWMLYGDPQRTGRRYLQDYDSQSLDHIQRYLLVLLWYGTTDLGRDPWLSCNPPPSMPMQDENCIYQKPVGKLANGIISYTPIPWTRWLTGADECEWAGVSCKTVEGRLSVTGIELGKFYWFVGWLQYWLQYWWVSITKGNEVSHFLLLFYFCISRWSRLGGVVGHGVARIAGLAVIGLSLQCLHGKVVRILLYPRLVRFGGQSIDRHTGAGTGRTREFGSGRQSTHWNNIPRLLCLYDATQDIEFGSQPINGTDSAQC